MKTFTLSVKNFADTYKDEMLRAKAAHRGRLEMLDKKRAQLQKEINKIVDDREKADKWLEDEEARIDKKYNK